VLQAIWCQDEAGPANVARNYLGLSLSANHRLLAAEQNLDGAKTTFRYNANGLKLVPRSNVSTPSAALRRRTIK
jgi:hypothetical protein